MGRKTSRIRMLRTTLFLTAACLLHRCMCRPLPSYASRDQSYDVSFSFGLGYVPDYQCLLRDDAVRKLARRSLAVSGQTPSNAMKLVELTGVFYLQDRRGDLKKVPSGMTEGMRTILDTAYFHRMHHYDPFAIFFCGNCPRTVDPRLLAAFHRANLNLADVKKCHLLVEK